MFDLKLLKVNESNLVLGTPLRGRIILFGIAWMLGWMMIVNEMFSFVPGLLLLIALLAGLYTEKWQFNLDLQLVIHTEGLLFVNRKKTFLFQDMVRMELRNTGAKVNTLRSDFGPELPTFSESPSGLSATSDQDLEQYSMNRIKGKGFSGLFLILNDGRQVNVHTTSIKKTREQAILGQLISRVCRKPFASSV